jgi:hypothetical protein
LIISTDALSNFSLCLSPSQFKEELKVEGFYDPTKHDDAMLL